MSSSMSPMVKTRKKLIEVALPLDAINVASVRESYIYRGNPSAIHKWWAQRPMATARAVIFAQMVDDPSEYVDTLLRDPQLRRRAESDLKKMHRIWATAAANHRKALEAGVEAPRPGQEPTVESVAADHERRRLFRIVEELVQWENLTNERVLQAARDEIWQSWRRACADNADHDSSQHFSRSKLPEFADPFAGGGTLPLEAQRLGLKVYSSDLNPVAVLINKAIVEIPPKFSESAPVNPEWRGRSTGDKALQTFARAQGLADDVSYYGRWLQAKAMKRIGDLYPAVEVTAAVASERPDLQQYLGKELSVIAWLWARTVKSPNPAFAAIDVPLASTFMVSTKPGKEIYVEPVIEDGGYRFTVKAGKPNEFERVKNGTKLSRGSFKCLMSGVPISGDYIKAEGNAGRLGERLMAVVAEGPKGRLYLAPTAEQEAAARRARPNWRPEGEIARRMTGGNCTPYGLTTWGDLFTSRQLVAMETLSDLVGEVMPQVHLDACKAGFVDDGVPLRAGGTGATAYAEAIALYLAFAVDKTAEYSCTIVPWYSKEDRPKGLFARHAIPMVWDFAEVNPLGDIGGSFVASVDIIAGAIEGCAVGGLPGEAMQGDAAHIRWEVPKVVSTDPPYYDNIGYSDLADFFYVWLRRSLKQMFPDLFATLAGPKTQELVASAYRHGSAEKAEAFFLEGMTCAMRQVVEQAHPSFPVTIYYAFKQSESESESGVASTGWETFLDAVIRAGFGISGTWPMRTERGARSIGIGTNALASSIVLVCRPNLGQVSAVSRREFVEALSRELPVSVRRLQESNIAPVDLAQAAIGPGMAIFTRYSRVIDAEDRPISVRDALVLINQVLGETLSSQEGDFDSDTQWALAWFEQFGLDDGAYGAATVLAQAKNTAVDGLVHAGIVTAGRGKVRLLKPEEMPANWDPATDDRLTVWEMTHHLVRALEQDGESACAALVVKLGSRAEVARELCYRLYSVCEQKKRAVEALRYNTLVQSWPEIVRLAAERGTQTPTQQSLMEP